MRLKDSREQSPPILEAYAYRTRGDHAPDELSLRIDCRMVLAVALRYQGGIPATRFLFLQIPCLSTQGRGSYGITESLLRNTPDQAGPLFHHEVFEIGYMAVAMLF